VGPLTRCIRYHVSGPVGAGKSAVLMAGLTPRGKTVCIRGEATRDHTERNVAGVWRLKSQVEDTDEAV